MDGQKNVKALLSKIFGIVSIVAGLCAGGGLPFAIASLILSSLAKKTDPDNSDAKLGGTLGIVGIIISVLSVIIWIVIYSVAIVGAMNQ